MPGLAPTGRATGVKVPSGESSAIPPWWATRALPAKVPYTEQEQTVRRLPSEMLWNTSGVPVNSAP